MGGGQRRGGCEHMRDERAGAGAAGAAGVRGAGGGAGVQGDGGGADAARGGVQRRRLRAVDRVDGPAGGGQEDEATASEVRTITINLRAGNSEFFENSRIEFLLGRGFL